MFSHLKTFWQVVTTKTFGVVALLALVAAIPLTVFIAQQSQEVRQRASTGFAISGRVFVDANRNGQMDNGEKGFANATLTIRSPQEGCELPEPSEAPCEPRPACLDAEHPCLMPEPIDGWCEDDIDDISDDEQDTATSSSGKKIREAKKPANKVLGDEDEGVESKSENGDGESNEQEKDNKSERPQKSKNLKNSQSSKGNRGGSRPQICDLQAVQIGLAQTNENGLYKYEITAVPFGNVHTVELSVPEGYELTTPPNPKKADPQKPHDIDFGIAASNGSSPTPIPIGGGCTLDAKICPDGTAVGRVGPNCEFAPCPSTTCPTPPACDGRLIYGDPPLRGPNTCPVYKCIPATPTPTPSSLRGDLDGNGLVDLVDFNIMLTCIKNKDCPQKEKADLNGDGKINEVDWNILIREYLSRQRK